MKRRLIIYSVLLVVAAGTIFYVALDKQAPTGHGRGTSIYGQVATIGKIAWIQFIEGEQRLSFVLSQGTEFYCSSTTMMPIIVTAFQTQSTCWVYTYRDGHEVLQLILPEPPKGEEKGEKKGTDLEKEIKEMKNYLYWIWHYVWNISRRLR